MSNTKTEAQRLAALLDHGNDTSQIEREVINELRRLDAHNKAMHKIIDQLRAQLAESQSEREEQARLLGMSAERELSLRAQLSKAVAEEREACAKVCDERKDMFRDLLRPAYEKEAGDCAAAIRARSNT